MEKQDEPQVDGKRGGSHGPYAAYSGWDRLLAPTTNELQEKKKKRKKDENMSSSFFQNCNMKIASN